MFMQQINDWDDAYANAAHIARGEEFPPKWAAEAMVFRRDLQAAGRAQLDIPYGSGDRHRLDLFHPDTDTRRGLVVFIHGGFWRSFDKSSWSHLAVGPLAHGFSVAMPSYTLCPDTRIANITEEIGTAIGVAAGMVEGSLRITGHSAGGHLASRMACRDTPLPPDLIERLDRVVSISGVHDLRPLIRTELNETLLIDRPEALRESPALLEPLSGTRLICWVGAVERAEFLRQNALLANVWKGLGAATAAIEEPDRHHFDVIEGLMDPHHPLTGTLCA